MMTSVLELAVLGLLKEQPMHGYDLRKHLRADFGPLANLSFGSLYPALRRLERAGAVRASSPATGETELLPLTGSLGGERASLVARRATSKAAAALGTRARKVYEITARGEELFEELLDAPSTPGDDATGFSLRLAFARHLSPSARIRMLERRRNQLSERLDRSVRTLARPGRDLDAYERSIAEHLRDTIEGDLRWIEQLLSSEQLAAGAIADITTPAALDSTANRSSRTTTLLATTSRGARTTERTSR